MKDTMGYLADTLNGVGTSNLLLYICISVAVIFMLMFIRSTEVNQKGTHSQVVVVVLESLIGLNFLGIIVMNFLHFTRWV